MEQTPDKPEPKNDSEQLMDHVAMEAVHAVHNRDHESFRNAFHALVAHTLYSMSDELEAKEEKK